MKAKFKVSLLCAGLLVSLGVLSNNKVDAAVLYGSANATKVDETYCILKDQPGGTYYYQAAYEVYSNTIGATTDIAGVKIKIAQGINVNDYVNLTLTGAKFNPPTHQPYDPSTLYYALFNSTDLNSAGVIAATTATISAPQNNLGFRVLNSANANSELYLGVAHYNGTYIPVRLGASFNIDGGLNASCVQHPEVKIGYTAPNDTGEGVLIKILPKLGVMSFSPENTNFNAELDTDRDFKTFVGNATILNTCCERGAPSCSSCVSSNCTYSSGNQTPQPPSNGPCSERQWIVGYNITPADVKGTFTYNVVSQVPEPGVTMYLQGNTSATCTPNADKNIWTCSFSSLSFADRPFCLDVKLDGTSENNPTVWSITNISITNLQYSQGIRQVCYSTIGGTVGAWWGGLEAVIPFVRRSSDGAFETVIKLINRYNKDARVFIAPFKNNSGPIVVPLKEWPSRIPANGGTLLITAQQLRQEFGLTVGEMNMGMAFKLLIRVPSQSGCQGMISEEKLICNINPYDPYIVGDVVITHSTGHRTIPIKFKTWKNGAYSE